MYNLLYLESVSFDLFVWIKCLFRMSRTSGSTRSAEKCVFVRLCVFSCLCVGDSHVSIRLSISGLFVLFPLSIFFLWSFFSYCFQQRQQHHHHFHVHFISHMPFISSIHPPNVEHFIPFLPIKQETTLASVNVCDANNSGISSKKRTATEILVELPCCQSYHSRSING